MQHPTTFLPPIKSIPRCSSETLLQNVRLLNQIYTPPVLGFVSDASRGDLDATRNDRFERSYSIRWLTAVVSQSDMPDSTVSDLVLKDASRLLALCSGAAASPIFTRSLAFPVHRDFMLLHEGGRIEILLQDASLESQDFSAVGAQTWGSSCLLAEMVAEDPGRFSLNLHNTSEHLKILELGAGTGLISIVLAKLLSASVHSGTQIIATDFHSTVLKNLKSNISRNFADHLAPLPVSVEHLDWSDPRPTPWQGCFKGQCRLIFGADIVYERQHALWIKRCIELFLQKPLHTIAGFDEGTGSYFYLIIPLRRTHKDESETVGHVFPTVHENGEGEWVVGIIDSFQTLRPAYAYDRNQKYEDITYRYFKIGWGVLVT